jgi:N-acetylmuramoyl-L-alanine amidase
VVRPPTLLATLVRPPTLLATLVRPPTLLAGIVRSPTLLAALVRPPTLLVALLATAVLGGCGGAAAAGSGGEHPPATAATSARASTAPQTPPASARPSAAPLVVPRPAIVQRPIPFDARRKEEMRAYARRHYGLDTYRLRNARVIVIHYTETPDFSSTFNTFAPDVPDSELHELPGTCAHFVIDRNGTIYQLVPTTIMCRHTVGLNWTAIGIEHVGFSDGEVLADRRQMRSSLALVRWLRCRHRIPIRDVIGHNESLSSPYHHENVPSLRTQTHSDFNHADMQVYRARLRAAGGC